MGNTRFLQLPNVPKPPNENNGLSWPGFYPWTAYFTLSADGTHVVITDNPGVITGGGYHYTPSPQSLEFDPTIPQSYRVEIHEFVQAREIQIEVPDAYER